VIPLALPAGELSVLSIGAHPDDIEIGCGATLLHLAAREGARFHNLILTGVPARQDEARTAAAAFLPDGAGVETHALPDGRLPASWGEVKQILEDCAARVSPHVILAPRRDDAHQDHRLIAELVTTVWRDALVLHYEIPKWDGDLGGVSHYVGFDEVTARRKVELLQRSFPSQHGRDWWREETFLALMRLRGMECRAPYAEAFVAGKVLIRTG
jgi:LmbE family N-acetylglucosaminyl deacetylase